jgi:dTDP-4-dehydrorhamnose 3,5-epimerase
MSWEPLTEVDGVQVLDLQEFKDDRGALSENWRQDELRYKASTYKPAMCYTSWTKPGLSRGPHEHREQTDLFVFAGPGNYELYLWDADGNLHTLQAGESFPMAVLVPPGVVHGYKCISEDKGLVINMPDRLYRGPQKKGEVDEIRHEDDPDSPYKIP